MASQACLLSRSRPGKPMTRPVRGFLGLPGEVRNLIYQYHFQDEFRCEFAAQGCSFTEPKQSTVKLTSNLVTTIPSRKQHESPTADIKLAVIRVSRPLGKFNIVKGLQTMWSSSIFSLHLVCKLIYVETLAFVYHKTVFCFQAPKRIHNFLNTVSRSKIEMITSLELHYSTYGHPRASRDTVWQEKHHASWLRACKSISRAALGLEKLKLHVRIFDDPPQFSLREKFVSPLLHFRRPTPASSPDISRKSRKRMAALKRVKVKVRTPRSNCQFAGNPYLTLANEDLHRIFERAIESFVLGASEEAAMAEFVEAWEVKYNLWRNHLGFASTGW